MNIQADQHHPARENRGLSSRIVITGMGAVTPVGIGVPAYWDALIKGVSGVSAISRFDASALPVRIAAEVKNFNPADFLPKKLVRETDVFMHFAFVAAQEALEQSGCLDSVEPQRIGIVMGTSLSGLTTIASTQQEYDQKPGYKVSPRFVPKVLGNVAATQIAIAKGIRGPSLTVNTACSSGADAIGTAAMLLKAGEADVMLAVSADSVLCALMVSGLAQSRALSTRNDDPETACRPFDLTRDGFIMGEGGGALVLETVEHARKRGVDVKAELFGYASNTDGYHVTSPDPHGVGAIFAMQRALEKAGLRPEEIGYVNAHGTSTKVGDEMETVAIKEVFGAYAKQLPVSSTKSATGHLMGAGGITETIACIQAVREGILPPTLHYSQPDPACDLDYVPNKARPAQIRAAMSNAFGFGGQNAAVIVGEYRP